MFIRILLFLLIPFVLMAQEDEIIHADRVTVAALDQAGRTIRSGPGFLYNETTLVCSYSDVHAASAIRVQWSEGSTEANKIISYNESMDLAVLSALQEIPVETPIGSSTTLALGDKVFYWIQQGDRWQLTPGAIHQILDTGKGYNLILIESANYTNRSTPLYNSDKKIVGWLQGKRAIPMETIAEYAEKQPGGFTIKDLNRSGLRWKFSKPASAADGRAMKLSVSSLKTVSGPSSYSFQVSLPEGWEATVSDHAGKFLVRYEHAGICVEVRAMPLGSEDLLSSLEEIENTVFADFLRSELMPYSADYLTGFRASYEDSDGINPYSLQVFYTSSSQNLYLLSISYPQEKEEEMRPLVEQIFASFRM